MPGWQSKRGKDYNPLEKPTWTKANAKKKLKALEGLYGSTPTENGDYEANLEAQREAEEKEKALKAAKARREARHEEAIEQERVVIHARKNNWPFYAVPNAARRTMWEAIQAKKSGIQAGIPDLVFPLAAHGYHGLYIEMKRADGGTISGKQRIWLAILTENGYLAKVCNGSDEAIKLLNEYFNGYQGYSDDIVKMLQAEDERLFNTYGKRSNDRAERATGKAKKTKKTKQTVE